MLLSQEMVTEEIALFTFIEDMQSCTANLKGPKLPQEVTSVVFLLADGFTVPTQVQFLV